MSDSNDNLSHVTRNPVFGGLRPGKTQPACSDSESWYFRFRIYSNCIVYGANNKDADHTARMRRLTCVFVVRIWHKTDLFTTWLTIRHKINFI